MRVFLTGANGWVGSVIARELLGSGHEVLGLVRSEDKAIAMRSAGIVPVIGSTADLNIIREGVRDADGIVHTAFGLDMSRIAELSVEDKTAIETFGEAFAGTSRPIIVTGGVGLTADGETFTEEMRPPVMPHFPRASEQTTFAIAEQGAYASVVRLPRSVHGVGETHGFVPMLAALARDKQVSAYVGDGGNLWPAVHRRDAARVFRLALERGAKGEAYHAIAEEGVPFRRIAEAIGRQLGVPARSLSPEEAEAHFGWLAVWAGGNGPASSAWTRRTLGWQPHEPGLVADIDQPSYHG